MSLIDSIMDGEFEYLLGKPEEKKMTVDELVERVIQERDEYKSSYELMRSERDKYLKALEKIQEKSAHEFLDSLSPFLAQSTIAGVNNIAKEALAPIAGKDKE